VTKVVSSQAHGEQTRVRGRQAREEGEVAGEVESEESEEAKDERQQVFSGRREQTVVNGESRRNRMK
jgi:hypothetical protein